MKLREKSSSLEDGIYTATSDLLRKWVDDEASKERKIFFRQ